MHWIPDDLRRLSSDDCRILLDQETAADQFTALSILRAWAASSVRCDYVREMHLLWICRFLVALELHVRPTFQERRAELLLFFQAPYPHYSPYNT